LGAFTRYNFLDTDAAFRLSTDLESSEIPDDLSRLLVGADASSIWDYLTKISPEIETALERAVLKVDDSRQKLEVAQKELKDLQERPSNGKALTDAFRTALDAIQWKAPRATTPLTTKDEANGLQKALGHIQAILAAGPAAVSLEAISARGRELELARIQALPLDSDRARHFQDAKQHSEQAQSSERASQTLDRWLTYVNSGFASVHVRVAKAKIAADTALGRLGVFANGDSPRVHEKYASMSLESALGDANLNVQNVATQVADLEGLSAKFGKVASARAQAASQLRTAAEATFDAGHPRDGCPICRAKYSPQDLAVLVAQITSSLEQPSELIEVSAQLADARDSLKHAQGLVNSLQHLKQIANTINLAPDTVCASIAARLTELRVELAGANAELAAAKKDWEQLSNSGLTVNEHDLLRNAVSTILGAPEAALNGAAIDEARSGYLKATSASRKLETECLDLSQQVSGLLEEISIAAIVKGWNTQAQEKGGMQSLVIMQSEIASVQSQANALQALMNVDSSTSLSELSAAVVGASRIYSEATHAGKIESEASESISTLISRIEQLNGQVKLTSKQADNYRTANDTLAQLLSECSLERASQKSLDVMGLEINEIFSRIHAPNEYEYVGKDEMLLQTSATHEKRTLEQVSTGQRAAFALSVFLAMNRSAASAPPVILIDDPIAHIDDLNALSFLDYLRDLTINSNRQIFFATADTRIAALFSRKFSFLGESFKTISLMRD
jgi:chromosome segregation protein